MAQTQFESQQFWSDSSKSPLHCSRRCESLRYAARIPWFHLRPFAPGCICSAFKEDSHSSPRNRRRRLFVPDRPPFRSRHHLRRSACLPVGGASMRHRWTGRYGNRAVIGRRMHSTNGSSRDENQSVAYRSIGSVGGASFSRVRGRRARLEGELGSIRLQVGAI